MAKSGILKKYYLFAPTDFTKNVVNNLLHELLVLAKK